MKLYEKNAAELSAMLQKKECSAVELTQDVLERIEEKESAVGAYVTRCEDCLDQAKAVDDARAAGKELHPLAGIPIGIKDNISTKGIRTTCSSKMLGNYVPPFDATVMQPVREAGMVITGKMNMDEFAMGSTGETSYYGAVLNPVDKTRVPGGSSSGAAAAVAAGIVPLALGSDTGGSVRQPAAFCGVFGFKPTYGTVSRNGLVAYASSFDQIGAIARNASDCAALAAIISGRDCGDSTTEDTAPVRSDFVESYSLCGKIIGAPNEFIDNCGEDIRSAVNNALKKADSLGARVEYFSLPPLKFAVPAYYIVACAQASSNLARYDGVRFGRRAQNSDDLTKMYIKSRSEGFGREVRRRIMLGNFVLSAGYYDAYYNKALRARRVIRDTLSDAFKKYDFIAGAVYPSTAPKLGESLDDPLKTYIGDAYTVPANLAGLPAISVPCGKTAALQLMAAPFADENLLGAARCLTL